MILGVIRLLACRYLICATEVERVAILEGNDIFLIKKSSIYAIPRPLTLSESDRRVEERYVRLIQDFLDTSGLYYSDTRDLSHTYQRLSEKMNDSPSPSPAPSPSPSSPPTLAGFDRRFFWNKHIVTEFVLRGLEEWVVPVMDGFIHQEAFVIGEEKKILLLVSLAFSFFLSLPPPAFPFISVSFFPLSLSSSLTHILSLSIHRPIVFRLFPHFPSGLPPIRGAISHARGRSIGSLSSRDQLLSSPSTLSHTTHINTRARTLRSILFLCLIACPCALMRCGLIEFSSFLFVIQGTWPISSKRSKSSVLRGIFPLLSRREGPYPCCGHRYCVTFHLHSSFIHLSPHYLPFSSQER